MFIALNSNKERVAIENCSNSEKYYCPVCGERLAIRAIDSKSIRTHFAHKRGTICYDDFTHDMSEWHYNWQCRFPESAREIVIEKNGIKHRADILINNTVIEFQHSPITAEEINKRNEFYLSCGYNMVWVFDADNKIKNVFDGSINPLECSEIDLEWKRKRNEFATPMPRNVLVFLDYKIKVKKENNIISINNLIFLKNTQIKYIDFYNTSPNYIFYENFLKQFGIQIDDIPSIKQIFAIHDEYRKQIEYEKRQSARNIQFVFPKKPKNWRL